MTHLPASVTILTNFMNYPDHVEPVAGYRVTLLKAETWSQVRKYLKHVDLVIIDCRDTLLYRLVAYLLLRPWLRVRLIAVDLVLRRPHRLRDQITRVIKQLLFRRVDHFIHYFKDISGYALHFGIRAERSSYVPFKVNLADVDVSRVDLREDYIFTMGVSLRDYDTFIRAIATLPYPAAITAFSLENYEGRDRLSVWTKDNIPKNLTVLPDSGRREDLIRNLAKARMVVIPTQSSSLCASGISSYLTAMHFGKCVITTMGPGASDVLVDQALFVRPHDVEALARTIRSAWEDDALRRRVAETGRSYAKSLGGEQELLQRILVRSLETIPAMP